MKFLVAFLFPVVCFGSLKEISGLKASYENNQGEVSFLKLIDSNKSIPKGKYAVSYNNKDVVISKNKSEKFRFENIDILKSVSTLILKDFNYLASPFKIFFHRAIGVKNDINFFLGHHQFLCVPLDLVKEEQKANTLNLDNCLEHLFAQVGWSEFEGPVDSPFFNFVNGVFDYDEDDLNGKLVLNSTRLFVKDGYFELGAVIEKSWRPVIAMTGNIEKTKTGISIKITKAKLALFSIKEDIYDQIKKHNFKNVKVEGDKILVNLKGLF